MKLYHTLLLLLFSTVFCLVLGGCPGRKQAQNTLNIALVIQAGSNQFFESLEKGMREAAQDRNVRLVVIADREYMGGEQQQITKKLVDLNIRGIIIMPDAKEDSKKYSVPLILEANRHNIPVVFIHAAIDEDIMKSAGAYARGLVTNDKRMGSRLAAEYIIRKQNGGGTVLVMEGGSGGQKTEDSRREGFLEIAKEHPQVKILYASPGKWRREDAFTSACEALKKNPHVDSIFTYSESMLLGILDAIDSLKIKKPIVVGFDGTEEGCSYVRTGRVDALVDQKPREMGKAGIDYMIRLLNGEKLPEVFMIKCALMTKESFQIPFH